MEQKQKTKKTTEKAQEPEQEFPVANEQTAMDELDDLLDEIDGVLEENAEAFLNQYVQKGGE